MTRAADRAVPGAARPPAIVLTTVAEADYNQYTWDGAAGR